jgi:hypothetical protein
MIRIYKGKEYIVYSNTVDKPNAIIVTGDQLNKMVAGGTLKHGDRIFQTHLVATVKEKRELTLQGEMEIE